MTQHPLVQHPKYLVLGFHGWDEAIPQRSVYLVNSFFFFLALFFLETFFLGAHYFSSWAHFGFFFFPGT